VEQYVYRDGIIDPELVKWRGQGNPEHPVGCVTPTMNPIAREERGGWILGIYEHVAPARLSTECRNSSGRFFPAGLDRIADQYMAMAESVPNAPIRAEGRFNGPICYNA